MASWDNYPMYFPTHSGLNYNINYNNPLGTPMQSPSFPEAMSFPSMSHNSSGGSDDEKIKSRRYKTPSPQLLRMRRSAANERERRRMNTLNVAYDKLRTVLPDWDSGRRLSKFETLQYAQEYIHELARLLKSSEGKPIKKEERK